MAPRNPKQRSSKVMNMMAIIACTATMGAFTTAGMSLQFDLPCSVLTTNRVGEVERVTARCGITTPGQLVNALCQIFSERQVWLGQVCQVWCDPPSFGRLETWLELGQK